MKNTYKFRAECLNDIEVFKSICPKEYKITVVLDPEFPDVVATVETKGTLKAVQNKLKKVIDGHVMVQTITEEKDYTGKRMQYPWQLM